MDNITTSAVEISTIEIVSKDPGTAKIGAMDKGNAANYVSTVYELDVQVQNEIHSMVCKAPNLPSSEYCINAIPPNIRKSNVAAYFPRIVALGLCRDPTVENGVFKMMYFKRFTERNIKSYGTLTRHLEEFEERIFKCYEHLWRERQMYFTHTRIYKYDVCVSA